MTLICLTSLYKFELGNKTTISNLSVQQSNYHPLGAVDDPMNCCPLPSASGNSSSGHPQHLGGDSFDCCTERYEIVVLCSSRWAMMFEHTMCSSNLQGTQVKVTGR